MGMNDAPSGERAHIGFFGVRNAGKSSVVNAVAGQDLAVVSDTLGTTTDLVRKAMELLPAGPVVIVDTPGIDDAGELGELRVRKAREALRRCDVAVLVVDATRGLQQADSDLLALFEKRGVPYVIAWNKADLLDAAAREAFLARVASAAGACARAGEPASVGGAGAVATDAASDEEKGAAAESAFAAPGRETLLSAQTGEGIAELKELIARCAAGVGPRKRLVADLLDEGDVVVLVVPIDSSAPKGRIILPQQMVLRDALDAHAVCAVCQPDELERTLGLLACLPKLVVTDSQVFAQVAGIVPDEVLLTSFSILMARYKGDLAAYVRGAAALAHVCDGESVLISEGCTHHRQCEDIGTVKMPRWIRAYAQAEPEFAFTSGNEFPEDVTGFKLVVHCGGCMLNEKEMAFRAAAAAQAGVPFVNYGMAIAQMHGILERSLRPFADELGE